MPSLGLATYRRWIDLAVENINRKHEKDKADGKKVSRKKMTRSSYVRMCVVDKVRNYRKRRSRRR